MASRAYRKTIMSLANCKAVVKIMLDETAKLETNRKLLALLEQANEQVNALLSEYNRQELSKKEIKKMQDALVAFDSPMFDQTDGASWAGFAILQIEEAAKKTGKSRAAFELLINTLQQIVCYFDHNLTKTELYDFVACESEKFKGIREKIL